MSNPKISVIMAVYNAEPYLRRCLDSLQAQTLKDFDVIFVDDGSTDGSLAIGQAYAQADSRFRIYHKENGGVSSARQFGIDQLVLGGGKYSIHLDPDDWIEPDMLECLYQKAGATGADMVICDYYTNTQRRQNLKRQNPGSEKPHEVLAALFQRLHGSLCNKLIRSACYKDYDIRFPEGLNYCEDYIVNVQLLLHIQEVAYLPQAFYHYDQYSNQNPATRLESSERINKTRTEVVRRLREIVPESHKDWRYYIFEAHTAYGIIDKGSMADNDLRAFFNGLPSGLLLHPHAFYAWTFWAISVVRWHLPQRIVRCLYKYYRTSRHAVGVLLGRHRHR